MSVLWFVAVSETRHEASPLAPARGSQAPGSAATFACLSPPGSGARAGSRSCTRRATATGREETGKRAGDAGYISLILSWTKCCLLHAPVHGCAEVIVDFLFWQLSGSKIYRHQLGWNIQSNKARCRSPELPSLVCQQATAVLRKPPVDLTNSHPPPPFCGNCNRSTAGRACQSLYVSALWAARNPARTACTLLCICICGVRGRSSVGLVKSSCSSILLCIYIHLWIWCWMYALKERPESGHQNVNMPVERSY